MKRTRNVLMLAALVTLSIFMSCGGGGGGSTPSLQKQIIEALNGSTVALNIPSSTFGTATVASGTVTLNASDAGAATVDAGGDLASYVDSGSFTVSSDGSITGTSVIAASGSGLVFSGFGATVDSGISKLTITFTSSEESSREDGLGAWSVVIDL